MKIGGRGNSNVIRGLIFVALILTSSSLTAATPNEKTQLEILEQLNTFRNLAGLSTLSLNDELSDAAFRHARYLVFNDDIGHYEISGKAAFWGENPNIRAVKSGYPLREVREVIQVGKEDNTPYEILTDITDSVYHRFSTFSTLISEVGIGIYHNNDGLQSVVMVFGNTEHRKLCEKSIKLSDEEYDAGDDLLTDICSEGTKIIPVADWRAAARKVERNNARLTQWPPLNSVGFGVASVQEYPSPFPDSSYYGNPITITFNETRMGRVQLLDFSLISIVDTVEVEREVMILDHRNDPSKLMNPNEYAFIPLEPLDYSVDYEVWLRYSDGNVIRQKRWKFRTETLPWDAIDITSEEPRIDIVPGKLYALRLPEHYSLANERNLIFNKEVDIRISKEFITPHVALFKAEGEDCGNVTVSYLDYQPIQLRLMPPSADPNKHCLTKIIDALPGYRVYGLGETIAVKNNKTVLISIVPETEDEILEDVVWAARESVSVTVKQRGLNSIQVKVKGRKNEIVKFRSGTKLFSIRID